ncbi:MULTISPECIES: carbohydrate ABC transporter permease [Microbacterium]|uniref:Carbohydrate ABC transporter permease n=1 Tax=Microbacterium algihabitans TaxID=3075992 RepID=A0ABU3RT93_9MICO|nr:MULTISPECIES: carbohydrate ABC transporter permease [Microbacterium]MCD2168512.1 carbohydrate ABC transporter permease [Microbacterium sp. JC 701]MDU0326096.1 carbohydrate ABC transporter permease [Microbacterium sp. KSW2-21]
MTLSSEALSTRAITTGDIEGKNRRPRPRRRIRGVTGLLLGILCFLMLSPFIWMTLSVTKPTDVAFANPPVLTGYEPTLKAFVDLWETTYFADYLVNTLSVAVISTLIALIIGIPAAYALSRFPSYISALLLVLALIFRALPRFAVVLPMYDISRALGIYDTTFALAIALVAINQPFTIWLLRNFFAEIPRELDEAAMIDGCTRIGMLRRVMIPLMGPGILTAGIFVFLFAFQEYLTALVLTDTSSKTVPVFIATQLGQTLPMLQQAGAASMLLTIPVVIIAFIAQKYLVAGLSDGAVKG